MEESIKSQKQIKKVSEIKVVQNMTQCEEKVFQNDTVYQAGTEKVQAERINISESNIIDFIEEIKKQFQLKPAEAASYSPLVLAYLGDCIYEMVLRTVIVCHGNTSVNRLNQKTSYFAKATTQSELVKCIMEELTEEEMRIFKRGRNAKSVTVAKHASMTDYRMATGLEALIGYLYLDGRYERLVELIRAGIQCLEDAPSI